MQTSVYTQPNYDGGLNDTASPINIKRNEASLLRNWDITFAGHLKRRDGIEAVGTFDVSNTFVTGLHAYIRTNGAKDLLCTEGTNLRYLNSTTWTILDSGFTAGLDTNFVTCPINNKVYIDNGTDYTHSWDRAATTLNSCLTDMGTAIPHGKVKIWHKNHMFALNAVTVSGTTYYNRLYWSNLGDPDTFTVATDYIEMPGAGNLITAMDLGDALVIFKEYSVSFLTGWGSADWILTTTNTNVVNIDESVGCISKRGAVRVGNEVWFIDREGSIRRVYQTDFDAFRKDVLSTKITGTIDTINKTQLEKAVAWIHDNKVYFAVPTGTSTYNDTILVFDILAAKRLAALGEVGESWTVYTGINAAQFASYPTSTTPDLYIAAATQTTKVYKHAGDDDAGVAIDARWDSKDDEFDKLDKYKRYKFGYINGLSGSGDVDVDVYASVDLTPYAYMGSVNLQGSGSKLGPTGEFLLGPTGTNALGGAGRSNLRYTYESGGNNPLGKTIRHSIRHSTLNQQPTVGTFTSNYKLRTAR